jgi:hypothetical protein
MSSSAVDILQWLERPGASESLSEDLDVPAGRLEVRSVPLLAGHRGTPPDLILRWNGMAGRPSMVDTVVHLHGYSSRAAEMSLVRDKESVSGLDFADPDGREGPGRVRPTLAVLPRGNFFGGRSGMGYNFPALTTTTGLRQLVDVALAEFVRVTGLTDVGQGRLIVTAHSGGGAALMRILRANDPDEIQAFDALYGDAADLVNWARARIARDLAAVSAQSGPLARAQRGAMRVLYRPGTGTAANSRLVYHAIQGILGRDPSGPIIAPSYRVEATSVSHGDIPRRFGWRLLANAAAALPGVVDPSVTREGHEAAEAVVSEQATPDVCDEIARIAEEEFRRWHPGTTTLRETDVAATPILQDYYRRGVAVEVSERELQSSSFQDAHPWSAVFVSWVVRTAGAGSGFAYSRAHQGYLRAARQNRLTGNASRPFWAYRPTEVVPRRGDMVCASRAGSGATYDNIGDSEFRAAHCDIVTEVRPGELRVIGGNVGQTVGAKRIRTDPDGRLSLDRDQARFFAVIRCSSAPPVVRPKPQAPERSGPVTDWTHEPLDVRLLHVMEVLVNDHGYPVNGAAGLVGNLIAESGVLPNRIEGSHGDSPMRAPDFSGQVRDFTPDEVMNRDYSARRGPRLPGIGLAQWTTAGRRSGLFRHEFRGRRLGADILFDMDAQVDYLVRELRSDYSRIDQVLRAPTVTAANASDEVVYRFEVPGSVLDEQHHRLPTSDARVQEIFSRRRREADRALRVYRAAHP